MKSVDAREQIDLPTQSCQRIFALNFVWIVNHDQREKTFPQKKRRKKEMGGVGGQGPNVSDRW